MKKLFTILCCIILSLPTMAQTSGGQIRRKNKTVVYKPKVHRQKATVAKVYNPINMEPNMFYMCVEWTKVLEEGQELCRRMEAKGYDAELVTDPNGDYYISVYKTKSKEAALLFYNKFKDKYWKISYPYYDGELLFDFVAAVSKHDILPTPIDKLPWYNIVVASYKVLENAQIVCEKLKRGGGKPMIYYDTDYKLYRVLAIGTLFQYEVKKFKEQYSKTYPDAWVLYVKNGVKTYQKEGEKKQYSSNIINNLINKMVLVEGGTFTMGCRNHEMDATSTMRKCEKRFYKNARPVHEVTLKSFYISSTQVTQQEWELVMGNNPSSKKGELLPVHDVSWYSANEFIAKLNSLTGMHFRLPTEAEWEYAARGGKYSKGFLFSGSNKLSDVSYMAHGLSDKNLYQKVASYLSNELGIYDMTGNGEEWCQDWYSEYKSKSQTNPTGPTSGTEKVIRGISAASIYGNDRIFSRFNREPDIRWNMTFRLVLDNNYK